MSIAQSLGTGGESLDLDDTMHTEDHGDDGIYGSRKCWRLPRAASLPPANGCIRGRLPSPPTASIYCGCILSIPFFVHDLDKCGIMEYATSALRLAVKLHWISLGRTVGRRGVNGQAGMRGRGKENAQAKPLSHHILPRWKMAWATSLPRLRDPSGWPDGTSEGGRHGSARATWYRAINSSP